jgi:hypothetical protein
MATVRAKPLLTISVLVAVVFPAEFPPAGAAGQTRCTFRFDVTLKPGQGEGSFTTGGETGDASCDGPVNGQQPTGPGKTGAEGHYRLKDRDNCASGGGGSAVQTFTFPTREGKTRLTNRFTFTFGELSPDAKPGSGRFDGDRMSGSFEFRPTEGDCFTKPVTKARGTGEGTLRH